MHEIRIRKILVLAALAALVGAVGVSAYVLLSPTRTWSSPPNYIVDNRGLASVNDGNGGVTAVVNAINNSSVGWNSTSAGTVVSASAGSVSGFSLGDGVPMLNFQDPQNACTGNCLAATFTGYFSGSTIFDADIVTNTSHSWTSQGEDPGGSGCSGEFYIEGVQVHEVGHGLGIGHSNVSGATMFPSVSSCNNAPASIATDDANAIVALYGSGGGGGGGGGGGAPCTGCDHYTGFLSGSGDEEFEPNGTYYFSGAGTHQGWLEGAGGTDFDLRLWRWNGFSWVTVASSLSSDSSEFISYNGTSGYYAWRINSWSGSGSYDFWLDRP